MYSFCQTELSGGYISKEQLHEDLIFIHTELVKYHPRLYAYSSSGSINLLLKRMMAEIDEELTLKKCYFFAAQLFSYLTNDDFIYFKRNEDIEEFEPLYQLMQPNKLNFQGKVYVFVNGGSLSTTGHLISLLKFHTDAVFIGEEPGSILRCNDFSIQLTLPNSGIELNIPRTSFETFVSGFTLNDAFVIDYGVNITAMNY